MKKISVELKNCYGIGEFSFDFNFANGTFVYSIYAPNGFMKTSFARTLRDIAEGVAPRDQMFPSRPTTCRVLVDGEDIRSEQILVIPPYDQDYQPRQVTNLLVSAPLKEEYEAAVREIDSAKQSLIKALKDRSRLSLRVVETEILRVFGGDDLLSVLDALEKMAASADSTLRDVRYDILFSDKALKFLAGSDAKAELATYVERYRELISNSPILNEKFNHTGASSVQKSLADAKFFEARHWLVLNDAGGAFEVRAAKDLKDRIDQELARISDDGELKKAFLELDRKISANEELRQLRDFLRERPELVARCADLHSFQKDVWGAYISAESEVFQSLVSKYRSGRVVIEKVVERAKGQETEWAEVVDLFNQRFDVPFQLSVENKADVILKSASPRLSFSFKDGSDTAPVKSAQDLLMALSQGERRALYLLNVLFEVRAREKEGGPVLVVADDVADSFDYKNKYAIIEYLNEIAESGLFRLIVLTHNFDFHRTVGGRLRVNRKNRLHAVRDGRSVSLVEELLQRKTPLQYWQEEKKNDPEAFIASIPFVRNLAEYCGHKDVEGSLTELLHIKPRTMEITLSEIDEQYRKVISGYVPPAAPSRDKKFWETLEAAIEKIRGREGSYADLEAKVTLSVAIRLNAELYMIDKIADPDLVGRISSNQTCELLREYRARFPDDRATLSVLGRVQLMTPENIHVNSFMYEPILDLGIGHLKRLYDDVVQLSEPASEAS